MACRRSACRTRLSPDGVRAPVQVRGVLAKGRTSQERDDVLSGTERVPDRARMVAEVVSAGHRRLSRLDDAGLRWRLRSALTHLRVRSLAVLGRRLASLAHARRTQLRQLASPGPRIGET